jgi:hypothetical protein
MDTDVMMELTQKNAVSNRSLTAISLVPQMVHIAVNSRPVAPRPRTMPVAQLNRPADVSRDTPRVPDIQRQTRAVERLAQQPLAQDRREPCRTRNQLNGELGHRVPQRPPGLR